MIVIVVGCGRLGSTLAYQLSKNGHQVTVIDQNASSFDNLPPDFHGRVIEGDVLSRDVLHRAEFAHAESLAVVTNSDTLNAVVAHMAKTVYHIPKVVVRNYDPRWKPFQEEFDLEIVSTAGWGVHRIEDLLVKSPLQVIYTDEVNDTAICQIVVPKRWQGRRLKELFPDARSSHMTISRQSKIIQNSDDPTLIVGDMIYLTTSLEQVPALRQHIESLMEN